MGYRIIAEEATWESYYDIPNEADRAEAWTIIRTMVDDKQPPRGEPNIWEFAGDLWAGYSIDLSSGRGFIPYAPIQKDDGEEVIRLWPVVWYPGDV